MVDKKVFEKAAKLKKVLQFNLINLQHSLLELRKTPKGVGNCGVFEILMLRSVYQNLLEQNLWDLKGFCLD